jgi:hypothetical protein
VRERAAMSRGGSASRRSGGIPWESVGATACGGAGLGSIVTKSAAVRTTWRHSFAQRQTEAFETLKPSPRSSRARPFAWPPALGRLHILLGAGHTCDDSAVLFSQRSARWSVAISGK